MSKTYPDRTFFRKGETLWARLEGAVNKVTGPTYNPLYHLGTLTIYLFLVLLVTGIYLTIFYRPGSEVAYPSVQRMTDTLLGSLMRSVHRYAADALALVVLLHLVKMFLTGRFWGSRWLAWITGFVLLGVSWWIGTMGYWLVWDKQAQWMTEYGLDIVRGSVAQTFLEADIASRTYAFFVIILFLHVFLGLLIVLGVLLHVIRLNRARFWSPRWLMVEAGVILLALSILQPVSSNPPADLNSLVGRVEMDVWYLGFMKLVEYFGNGWVWGVSLAVLGIGIAMPWLAKGETDLGPAIIIDDQCTGCTLCSVECPYGAIDMVEREDGSQFKMLAVIKPNLCTSCGICVGACATSANQLPGLLSPGLKNQFVDAIKRVRANGESPVAVFTCQRHETLGTFAGMGERNPSPVAALPLAGGNPHPGRVGVRCTLPCVGYLPPDWEDDVISAGAQEVVVVSCPCQDCSSREGPKWLAERARRKRTLDHPGHHWFEAAPGDQASVKAFFARINAQKPAFSLPDFARKLPLRIPAALTGLLILFLAFGFSLLAEYPVRATSPDLGALRIVLLHQGVVKSEISELPGFSATLPPGTSPEQFFGGEKYPVQVQLWVDGELVQENTYTPGGIRHENPIYGFSNWQLPPGIHQVRISLRDDDGEWRILFQGQVSVDRGQVRTLTFDENQDTFVLR